MCSDVVFIIKTTIDLNHSYSYFFKTRITRRYYSRTPDDILLFQGISCWIGQNGDAGLLKKVPEFI